jgi:asparagine synthase (glutamine-hydrolysing)
VSALAGVFFFDRRPISPDLTTWLSTTLREYGPDRGGDFTTPGLAMVHRALMVTSEDLLDQQPLRSPGGHVLTWDGRLDNRDTIALATNSDTGSTDGDAAIVLKAYDKWGDQAFPSLIGDWSLALWDAKGDALLLASDYAGIRPLYYYSTPTYIAWSTCLATLALLSGRRDDLSERYIAGFLTMRPAADLTPYRDIFSLTPGTVMRVTRTATTVRWQHAGLQSAQIEYARFSDYVEHFADLFRKAVHCRLRSRSAVWAELSGGVDSTSVVSMASRLVSRDVDRLQLHTVSYLRRDLHSEVEQSVSELVARDAGTFQHWVETSDDIASEGIDWVTPDGITPARATVHAMMAATGGRVLLAGDMGNATTGDYPDYRAAVFHRLRQGRLRLGFQEADEWSRVIRTPRWRVLARAALGFKLIDAMNRRGVWPGGPKQRAYDREEYRRRYGLASMLFEHALTLDDDVHRVVPKEILRTKPMMALGIQSHLTRRILAARERHHTVRATYPFADRRLVDFMLSVPSVVLRSPTESRSLMMTAVEGLLPSTAKDHWTNRYISGPSRIRQRPDALRLLKSESLMVVDRGFVDREVLRERVDAVCEGRGPMLNLKKVEYLEHWLRLRCQRENRVAVDSGLLLEARSA